MMLGRLLWFQIRSNMQYRLSFLLDLINIVIFGSMQFLSLALVFDRFETLGGWTLGEVAFLWSIGEMGFGVNQILFNGFDPKIFSQHIRVGSLDLMLLRPIRVTTQVLGSNFDVSLLARPLKGLAIFLIAVHLLDLPLNAGQLLFLPFAITGAALYFGSFYIMASTTSIWTVVAMDTIETFANANKMMMNYPFHVYPDWLRIFFTYVVPASLLNYYPVLYLLKKPDPFGLPVLTGLLAPLAGVVLFGVSLLYWQHGLRSYQSTGT